MVSKFISAGSKVCDAPVDWEGAIYLPDTKLLLSITPRESSRRRWLRSISVFFRPLRRFRYTSFAIVGGSRDMKEHTSLQEERGGRPCFVELTIRGKELPKVVMCREDSP